MAAIISGNGLGLLNTSLNNIGGQGVNGNGSFGQAGGQAYVNIATGNLVIQSLDQRLAAIGQDIAPVRTYNSQGSMGAGNQWDWEGERRAYLSSGTLNSSGSIIKVVEADGHETVYQYVSTNTYQSTEGDGAYDTIDTSSGNFVWSDGSTQLKITYDTANNGRLKSITDLNGTNLLYSYDPNGRLISIRDTNVSGEEVVFSYDTSNRLTGLATKHNNGALIQNVTYTYDTQGRLKTVTTDLTPENTTDSNVYTTTYGYDDTNGVNFRIASISQSDGTKVSFTYVQIGTIYKVDTVTDASGVTTFEYNYKDASNAVLVTNSAGEKWEYQSHTSSNYTGQLFSTSALDADGNRLNYTRFYYDANGNLIRVNDPLFHDVIYGYDDNGNRTTEIDELGNAISRSYDLANNRLLSETSYSAKATLVGGSAALVSSWQLPTTGQINTTRYVYGVNGRLSFVVSPEGRVSRYLYTAFGQVDRVATFVNGYTDTVFRVEDLLAWETITANKAYAALSKFSYDNNGNLKRQIDYAALSSNNNGNVFTSDYDNAGRVTDFVYDQYGRLLQQIIRHDVNRAASTEGVAINLQNNTNTTDSFSSFAYDGIGRLTGTVSAAGTTTYTYSANVTSNNNINYTGGKIAVFNSASGLFSVQAYDAYGRTISLKQSDNQAMTGMVRQTSYSYDAAGRLQVTTLPTGGKIVNFYDLSGRLVGVVDAAGALTKYVYDAAGLLRQEVRFSTAVNPFDASGNPKDTLSQVEPAIQDADRITDKVYDSANRLTSVKVADKNQTAYQYTTTYVYDSSDRLIKVTNGDRVTRYYYDGENRQVAVWDAEGYLSEGIYNPAGQKIRSNRYSTVRTVTDPVTADTATLVQLRPASDSKVLSNFYFYDKRGQLVGMIDEQQFVTSYIYDEKNNIQTTRRYATAYTSTPSTLTINTLSWSALSNAWNGGVYEDTVDSFNQNGQLKQRQEAKGRITTFDYDGAGRLIKSTMAAGQGDERQVLNRYNVFGELTASLSGETAALTIGKNATEINAIFDKYAVKSFYDAAGRKTQVMDAAGQLTTFYYDAANRLTHVINADGDVVESGYNIFSELERTTRYYYSLSATDDSDGGAPTDARATYAQGVGKKLKGGLVTPAFSTLVAGIKLATKDQIDSVSYTNRGLIETQTNGISGNLTTLKYNRFGELENKDQKVTISGVLKTVTENYQYSKRGELKVVTEDVGGLNLQTQREYDAFGRVIKVTDARGKITTTDYTQDKGRKVVVTAPNSNVNTVTYDAWGRQLSIDNNGSVTSYVYDDTLNPLNNDRNSLTVTSPEGVVITTSYNLHGEVVEVKDKNGVVTATYTYNRDGQKVTEKDAFGYETTYNYGTQNSGLEKFGLLKETISATGSKVSFGYDFGNRLNRRREYLNDTDYQETCYYFDGQGRQLKVIEAYNTDVARTTTYSYDKAGRLETVTQDPGGLNLLTTYTYDELNQQVEVWQGTTTAPSQQVTRYVYDTAGRRVKEIRDPNGLALTTEYRYDANDNVIRKIDAGGNSTWYVYDDAGNVIYTVDAAGGIVKNVYNSANQLVATYQSATAKTVSTYQNVDALASNLSIVNDGEYIRTVYDEDGRVRYQINALGTVTENTYNSLGQLSATIIYKNAVSLPVADALILSDVGNALAGNTVLTRTSYFYDTKGQVQYTVDGMGYLTRTYYNGLGQVTATRRFEDSLTVTDATTTASIHAAYASGKTNIRNAAYYDKLGHKIIDVDGEGQVSRYEYNAQGQLIASYKVAIKDSDLLGTLSATTDNYRSQIDALSADKVIVNRYYYDNAGRLVYSMDALGYVTANDYNSDGTIKKSKQYALPITGVSSTSTLADIATKLAALPTPRFSDFYYDSVGRKVIEVDAADYVTRYDYDAAGNLTAQTRVNATETTLLGLMPAGTTASADNLKTAIDLQAASTPTSVQTTRYYYDAGYRLVYTVDALGYATRNYYLGDDRVYATRTYTVALTGVTADSTTADIGNKVAGDNTLTWTYYDKSRRKTVEEDAAGYVTRYEYDAVGNLIRLTRVNATGASLVSGDRTSENLQAAIDDLKTTEIGLAKLQMTTYYYDAAGRNTYTVDAEGAVSRNEYNDYGYLYRQYRYAGKLNALPDPLVVPTVTTSSADQVSIFYYDNTGRVISQHDAALYATINTYDGFGNLVSSTRLADPLLTAGWGAIQTANADSSKARITTLYEYDKLGQKTKEIDGEGYSVSTIYDGFGNAVIVTDKLNNNGYFYYDNLNRNVGKLDPEGNYTRYYYDGLGRQTEERKYAIPVKYNGGRVMTASDLIGSNGLPKAVKIMSTGDTNFPTDQAYIESGGSLMRTIYAYDLLDRKTRITYPVSTITEVYEYWSYQKDAQGNVVNDANGNPIKIFDNGTNQPSRYQNKLGGWYSYTYDKLGRLKTETLPVKTFNSDSTALLDVVNTYDYDGFGNKVKFTEATGLAEQRVSVYGYDKLNRLTSKTAEEVSAITFNPNGGASSGTTTTATPSENYQYDAFGNQILKVDANGAKTFSYYNANNLKTQEIKGITSTQGSVSYWEYNAAGQVTLFRQYETLRTLPATAGGAAPTAPADNGREMRYVYDKVGRQTATILPGATVYDHDAGGVYGLYNNLDLVTTTRYDANGNVVQVTDARGNSSYTYYDKIGRKTLFVDNENYVTRWEYDDAANKQKETRYATALERVVKENYSAVGIINSLVSTNPKDRITTTTFDLQGRAYLIEVAAVAYGTVSNTGVLSTGIASNTTYINYNGLDQLTLKTEGYGSSSAVSTMMDYDKLGRQVLTTFGTYTDVSGATVSQRIATEYNGLGLTRQVAILGSTDTKDATNTRMTFDVADDRITTYSYDKLGRLIKERDDNPSLTVDMGGGTNQARYHEVNYSYDLAGNQTRITTYRTGGASGASALVRKQDETLIAYDLQGLETARRVQSRNEGATITAANVLEQRETRYNAFGEVTGKRLVKFDSSSKTTDPWQEITEYNNQGKVWKTNADKGVTKYYVYDRNGNAALQLETLNGSITANSAAELGSLNNVTFTETRYDKRNQVVEVRQPQFNQTIVDAGINVFEQPLNFRDDVGDTFELVTSDNRNFASRVVETQQLQLSGLDASITRVTLYYWPKGLTSNSYNTKSIEMQQSASGTFVLGWGALAAGEYSFKYTARNAAGTAITASSGANGVFKRELVNNSNTYPGGSIGTNNALTAVTATMGTVAADYLYDPAFSVSFNGLYKNTITFKDENYFYREVKYNQELYANTVQISLPATLGSLGTDTYTVELTIQGSPTLTQSDISASAGSVTFTVNQLVNDRYYDLKIYKKLPGGLLELVNAKRMQPIAEKQPSHSKIFRDDPGYDSDLLKGNKNDVIDGSSTSITANATSTPLKQLVISGLGASTARVAVEYRLKDSTEWGILDANVSQYVTSEGATVNGWYKVDLSPLDAGSVYEYRYLAYDTNDVLVKGGQGTITPSSYSAVVITNQALPALVSQLVNKPETVNVRQDEIRSSYATDSISMGAQISDGTNNGPGYLTISYEVEDALIRKYVDGKLLLSLQSIKNGSFYTSQLITMPPPLGTAEAMYYPDTDGKTIIKVQIPLSSVSLDTSNLIVSYDVRLMVVEDGVFATVASGKENFIYNSNSGGFWYTRNEGSTYGLKFAPKQELQLKGQQASGVSEVLVYYREAGSLQAYRYLDAAAQATDAYGQIINGQFNLNLLGKGLEKNKNYEVQYVVQGDTKVVNRQHAILRITDTGINIAASPLNFGGDGFTTINQLENKVVFYDVGQYVTLRYRKKGTQDAWISTSTTNAIDTVHGRFSWTMPSAFRTNFDGELEYQLDTFADDAQTVLLNSISGSVTIQKEASSTNSRPVDVSFIPREFSVRTLNFADQPAGTKTLALRYGNSETTLSTTPILLPVTNGTAMWDVTSILDGLAATASKTVYFDIVAYDDTAATGLVLNRATGNVTVGFGGGAYSMTPANRDSYVDIQPPKAQDGESYSRMELYYRLRPTDSTGRFSDIFGGNSVVNAQSNAVLSSLKALNFTKVTLTSSNGLYRWNTTNLVPESGYADYEYFYELYDASNNKLSFVPGQLHVTPTDTGYLKQSKWQINGSQDESTQIIRSQTYNAFGEIDAERDGNGNVTTSVYNSMGKLIEKHTPVTDVTDQYGATSRKELVNKYVYDAAGRLVANTDAKGNTTRIGYVNGRDMESGEALVGTTWQANNTSVIQQYNVYGDLTRRTNELGLMTNYGYDSAGNLSLIFRPTRDSSSISYTTQTTFPMGMIADMYFNDEQGNRIIHLNALGLADTTIYDALGRVIQTTTAGNAATTTTYAYDSSITGLGGVVTGGIKRTVKDANNKTSVDELDYFGHVTWHKDLGGNTYSYAYNAGGKLVKQTSSQGQNIDYEYYNNGYQKAIHDIALGMQTEYTYDNNGNVTGERYSEINANGEPRIYQNSHIVYDELNRKVRIWDEAYSIHYEYDENSNIRHLLANYSDGVNGSHKQQDFYYEYDQLNRFTTSMGRRNTSGSTPTIERGDTGVDIIYTLDGQRDTVIYGKDALGTGDAHKERYTYSNDGYLEKIEATTNSSSPSTYYTIATRQNDALGRIINYKTYKQNSSVLEEEVISEYNNDNQVKKQIRNKDGTATTTNYTYFNDNVTLEKTVVGTQTTDYSYEWWDSAKQSQIHVEENGYRYFLEGWSDFKYDVNGHLKFMTDTQNPSNRRQVNFVNSSQGMILQRNELINDSLNRYRNFYYVDGQRIGDISNDGTSREDYATMMATARKPAVEARNFQPVSSADFDQNYEPINQTYPSSAPSSYTVNTGDTLQGIALAVWGDSSMWFVLADVNGLDAGAELKAGQVLIIPNKVTNIHHNTETNRPYSPGEAIGNTQPTLPNPPPPPKPKKKCGGLGQIIMIIVAVVVTVVVSIFLTPGAGATVGQFMFAAAASAAAGSIASQAVGMAIGVVDKFSWKQVAISAVTAALTAGATSALGTAANGAGTAQSSWINTAAKAIKDSSTYTAIFNGVVGYGSSYVANQVFGNKQKFSWSALGASVAGSMIASRLDGIDELDKLGAAKDYVTGVVGANASAFAEDKWFGGTRPNYVNVSMAAIANTAGRKFGEKIGAEINDWGIERSAPEEIRQNPALMKTYKQRMGMFLNHGVSIKDSSGLVTDEYYQSQTDTPDMEKLRELQIRSLTKVYPKMSSEQAAGIVDDLNRPNQSQTANRDVVNDQTEMAREVNQNIDDPEHTLPTIILQALPKGSFIKEDSMIGDFLNSWQNPISGLGRASIRVSEEIEKHPLIGYGLTAVQIMSGPILFAGQTALAATPMGEKIEALSGEAYNALVGFVNDEGRIEDLQKAGEMVVGGFAALSIATLGVSGFKDIVGRVRSFHADRQRWKVEQPEIEQATHERASNSEQATSGSLHDVDELDNLEESVDAVPPEAKPKPYSNPKRRPKYAKGQVDTVWKNAQDEHGNVYDPNTGESLSWDKSKSRAGQWDMGHLPGQEYNKLWKRYQNDEIDLKEFLEEYRDPKNYQPESPSANRSHAYEAPEDTVK